MIPRLLLALSLSLLLLIGVSSVVFETAWTASELHPRVDAMEVGGARASDDAEHWWLGYACGVVMIMIFTLVLLLGTEEARRRNELRLAISTGGFIVILVFTVMMLTYRDFATTETPTFLGPFPTPTSWMIFGMWAAPAVFTLIYCLGFKRWFAVEANITQRTPSATHGDEA